MANYDLKKSPGHLLRRAQQYAHDLHSNAVGADGPTPRQFEVLHVVSRNKGISQTDLVKATGIDRSTLADMIARMLKKGLLSRSRDKDDARANNVSITPAGQRILSSAASGVSKADAATLNALPKAQQAAFMKALGAYAEALDKLTEGGAAKPARKKAAKKAPAKKKAKRGRR
jgi:DNA-binding MarR family transcriptional regulator